MSNSASEAPSPASEEPSGTRGSSTSVQSDDDWYAAAVKRVKGFQRLRPGWDSYGALVPNPVAIQSAISILSVLRGMGRQPHRVAASVEGGIVISFRNKNRYGDIECDNEGDIIALTSNGEGDVRAEPVTNDPRSIEEALTRIGAYVGA
jgi:hypothetical protein